MIFYVWTRVIYIRGTKRQMYSLSMVIQVSVISIKETKFSIKCLNKIENEKLPKINVSFLSNIYYITTKIYYIFENNH